MKKTIEHPERLKTEGIDGKKRFSVVAVFGIAVWIILIVMAALYG